VEGSEKCRDIWNRFIGTTATQPINLTVKTVQSIKAGIDNPSMLLFLNAKQSIARLLEGDLLWKYNKWLVAAGTFLSEKCFCFGEDRWLVHFFLRIVFVFFFSC
jgi:hypothetical protein